LDAPEARFLFKRDIG